MNYHAALASFPKITYLRYKRLRNFFPTMADMWMAEIGDFVKAGIEEEIGHEFIVWREEHAVEKITEQLAKENIHTVSLGESGYPRLLAEIADPPHTLFVRGKLPIDEQPTIGVVGTRKCTQYGQRMTEELTGQLAAQGVVIVSGLALGIDGYAHAAAVEANGTTIAVLGSGVDRASVYPASHQPLAEDIIARGGALVSEYPPSFEPTQYSFPARNRVIAGLSLGILVTEAPTESGALITAKCALDYNRDVFAVPHLLTSPNGEGCNNLIKMGAKLITKAQDILDELQIQNIEHIIANNQVLPSTPNEAKLLPLLSKEPTHIDLLIKQSGLDSPTVNSTLTMMEMKGKVKNVGGMMYIIR